MNVDFNKMNGLVPAIVQDALTGKILMQGYMNKKTDGFIFKWHVIVFYYIETIFSPYS